MLGKNQLSVKKAGRIDRINLIFFFFDAKDDFVIIGIRYYPLNTNGVTFARVHE